MVGENQPYRLMVKIGCLEVTTLQLQGIKEMDTASGVVWPNLPLNKKAFSPDFLTEGNHILSKVGFATAQRSFLQLKSNSGHREI